MIPILALNAIRFHIKLQLIENGSKPSQDPERKDFWSLQASRILKSWGVQNEKDFRAFPENAEYEIVAISHTH